jgi:hypothetical protein
MTVREAAEALIDLKDGPRDDEYQRRKPDAWAALRAALDASPPKPVDVKDEIIKEFAQHGSWRCAESKRFPYDGPWPNGPGPGTPEAPDCACGLIKALREAGIDPKSWMP